MGAISNVNELQDMNLDLAGTYWLANDIDASATSGWNGGAGFIPVGDDGTPFTGSFNAKHYEITDLFIWRPLTEDVGLFGGTDGATIQKVRIVDCDITGEDDTGALVGDARNSTITDCRSTGEVTGVDYVGGLLGFPAWCTVTSCSSTCTVTGDDYIGGLGGWCFDNTFSQCFASGAVSGDDYISGFLGVGQQNDIDDCYATGAVNGDNFVAGFISYSYDAVETVDNCYSTGAVTGNTNDGGFMGFSTSTVANCFWDTETSGQAASAAGTGKTTSEMKDRDTFIDAGWDFVVIWGMDGSTNDGYAFFWTSPPEAIADSPRETVAVEDKITLEAIRNVEMAGGGRSFINGEGNFVYKSRYARNT